MDIKEESTIKNPLSQEESSTLTQKIQINTSQKPQDNAETIDSIIKKIFKISPKTGKIIPLIKKNSNEEIKQIFMEKPAFDSLQEIKKFIYTKISILKKIKEIISNSYEILYIIVEYLSLYHTSPIVYIMELYIDYLVKLRETGKENDDSDKQKLLEEIQHILSWLISCGLLKKGQIVYLYRKIAKFQFENKLNISLFNDLLPLLDILYGKFHNESLVEDFIAKKYIFLYNKDTSQIRTNISSEKLISIKKGFTLIMWFYLNNYDESPKCTLCSILAEDKKLDFILNEEYDIEIKYNSHLTLIEKNNKKFLIKQKKWTQFKIQMDESGIKLYLFQSIDNSPDIKIESLIFDKKIYIIKNEKIKTDDNSNSTSNNVNRIDLKLSNYNIELIYFFINYLGIVGSIIFCNEVDTNEKPINCLYGLENENVNNFIKKFRGFPNIYFLFSPSLYLFENNKFIDSVNNVTGELSPDPIDMEKDILDLNSVLNYHHYVTNIFRIGGCNSLLPLFEIFYKFSCKQEEEKEKNKESETTSLLNEIIIKLFAILETVFVNKEKNCLFACKIETHFFESLQLFLDKIDEKYFINKNRRGPFDSLLKVGQYFYELKKKKIINYNEPYGYFTNILFDPSIIMKFDCSLQEKLFFFFTDVQKEAGISIPIHNLSKLLLLISQKYKNEYNPKSTLFLYIRNIFESHNITDNERENIFMIYSSKLLSDNIFINLMEIFIFYLDINKKNDKLKEAIIKQRNNSIKFFLYSKSYFIETILNYLDTTNIHIKKVIINFLRVLTQTYKDELDEYFIYIEKENKKNKMKNTQKINKEEFYIFIQENIVPNYRNKNITKDNGDSSIFYLADKEDENKDNKSKDELIMRKRISSCHLDKSKVGLFDKLIMNNRKSRKNSEKEEEKTPEKSQNLVDLNLFKTISFSYKKKNLTSINEKFEKNRSQAKQADNKNNFVQNILKKKSFSSKNVILKKISSKKLIIKTNSKDNDSSNINDEFSNSNDGDGKDKKKKEEEQYEDITINLVDVFNLKLKDSDTKSENNNPPPRLKSSMLLNVDLINQEYEINLSKFNDKVKSLAAHCNNYILGKDDGERCTNYLYNTNRYSFIEEEDNQKDQDMADEEVLEDNQENEKQININEAANEQIAKLNDNRFQIEPPINENVSSNSEEEDDENDDLKNIICTDKTAELNNDNENLEDEYIKIINARKHTIDLYSKNILDMSSKDEDEEDIYERELKFEDKVIIQKTKNEISLILYNWLICLDNNRTSASYESINTVIDFIVKFISYSKELDVIHKTLCIILSQKISRATEYNSNENYPRFLHYYMTNKYFIQLLEELSINSYIGKNDEHYFSKKFLCIIDPISNRGNLNTKKEYFQKIFELTKEILIDIYFSENNSKRNDMISDIFNIILSMTKGLEMNPDERIKNVSFMFIKELFFDISNEYSVLLKNKTEKKNHLKLSYDYICLFGLFFEYSFLLKTANNYFNKSFSNIDNGCSHNIPPFLMLGIIYDDKIKEWLGYDIYKIMFDDFKKIFSMKSLLKDLKLVIKDTDKKISIFKYEPKVIDKAIISVLKDFRSKYKHNCESLLISYQGCGYNNKFPLMNLISIFNSHCIYLFCDQINEGKKINIYELLNNIQDYIIYLLLLSINIKENDSFSYVKRTYKEIQDLIYQNLLYNIRNIVFRINNNEFGKYFIEVLNNIFSFISKIYLVYRKDEEMKNSNNYSFMNIFKSHFNIEQSGAIQLIHFYMKIYDKFFNLDNFNFFQNNNNVKSLEFISNDKDNLFEHITNLINQKENIDNSNNKLFSVNIFENIFLNRSHQIKSLRLLINKDKKSNHKIIINYKKVYLKVKNFHLQYKDNKITKNCREIFKIKNYRTIKKFLYSFNNSYSNLSAFYKDIRKNSEGGEEQNEKKILLKYKISNFLGKDMSRKLLVPIIDMDYYLPNFRKFDFQKSNIFSHSKDLVYKVDLQIFDNKEKKYPTIPDSKNPSDNNTYFIEDNVCYIKTTHHTRGKIFYRKHNQNNNTCFYFCVSELLSTDEYIKNYEDYDTMNKTCYGSLFRSNTNNQDNERYIRIKLLDIIFIFKRKYCFRDNSLEFFTSKHKSYYFKFKTQNQRNGFVENLVKIINKNVLKGKKLYRPIKSIDENNKNIILGYYKDIDHNKDYSNISDIRDLWKNNKISSLEYIMWINIYGNRSFRDIAQYPVFPWIISNYETDNFESIIKNNYIRNMRLPMGMMAIDERSKQRQINYIEGYKNMVRELIDEDIVNIKIEDEDENDNSSNNKTSSQEDFTNTSSGTIEESAGGVFEYLTSTSSTSSINLKEKMPNIPNYNFNINKLYSNLDIPYEIIPYCFGSHFSNGMYISHFLGRLFPYSLTMIEIQGCGFDCPDRLFLSLNKAFASSSSEKCDLRELIPEFYTLPELFLNINRCHFGEIDLNEYKPMKDEMITISNEYDQQMKNDEELIRINEKIKVKNSNPIKKSYYAKVEDVLLPKWCKRDPFYCIQKKRELLEKLNNILNPWIDLVFGATQRGTKAQLIGNLFPPYTYDGVMNERVKEEDVLKNRKDKEYLLRLFELGVNPTKVFRHENKECKKRMKQITLVKNFEKQIQIYEIKTNVKSKIRYIENIGNSFNDLVIIDKSYNAQKINIQENIDKGDYSIKETALYKELPIKKLIIKNSSFFKLIIKSIFKGNVIILAGFHDGSLYLINTNTKIDDRNINSCDLKSQLNNEEKILIETFGNGLITVLEISKDEKYFICGTINGSIIIYLLNYANYLEEKSYLTFGKILSSHSGHKINSISINSDLNLFADCSYDGFVHIYTLPKCKMINSIYINRNDYDIDHVFLSAQPLASIALYSNSSTSFKCFNINNHLLNSETQNDKNLIVDISKRLCNGEYMISPIVFTDYLFVDHLLYVFGNRYILLRKFPLMECVFKIDFKKGNELISMVNISICKKYIYATSKNNMMYLITYKNIGGSGSNQSNNNVSVSGANASVSGNPSGQSNNK